MALAEHRLASKDNAPARPGGERRLLLVHLREDKLQGSGTLRAELHDGTLLSGETLLRIACDSGVVAVKTDDEGTVLDIGRKSRTPSPALMHALRARDRDCVWPGCTCAADLEAHHLEHWAQGGETSLENTAMLCWAHHGLVHEGGFGMQRDGDGQLSFFEPTGRRIERVPAPAAVDGHVPDTPTVEPKSAAIHIDRRTSLPDWDGRPLELGAAVGALLRRAEHPVAHA